MAEKFYKNVTQSNKFSSIFVKEYIDKNVIHKYEDTIDFYPENIYMIIDMENLENPINDATKKPEYFRSLTEFENTNFQHLANGKPAKNIHSFNQLYIQRLILIYENSRNNKNINKYFFKKISENLVIFEISIDFVNFTKTGRIKLIGRHSCILLYNIKEKKGYYINPHYALDYYKKYKFFKNKAIKISEILKYDLDRKITKKLETIVSRILKIEDISINIPEIICPQAKAKGPTCFFWSLYLIEFFVEEFVLTGEIDLNKSLEKIYEKYPTVKKLDKLIKDYKYQLYDQFDNEYYSYSYYRNSPIIRLPISKPNPKFKPKRKTKNQNVKPKRKTKT